MEIVAVLCHPCNVVSLAKCCCVIDKPRVDKDKAPLGKAPNWLKDGPGQKLPAVMITWAVSMDELVLPLFIERLQRQAQPVLVKSIY